MVDVIPLSDVRLHAFPDCRGLTRVYVLLAPDRNARLEDRPAPERHVVHCFPGAWFLVLASVMLSTICKHGYHFHDRMRHKNSCLAYFYLFGKAGYCGNLS
jgi:hypothetical protein